MFWAIYSLKKGNGVKTFSALQGHYLWFVLSLLNQLLSPCRDPCSFIFMSNTMLKKEQLGIGFMLCNVMIFNTEYNGCYFSCCLKMSCFCIAPIVDGHAPRLVNLGTHLNANPIICKTTE